MHNEPQYYYTDNLPLAAFLALFYPVSPARTVEGDIKYVVTHRADRQAGDGFLPTLVHEYELGTRLVEPQSFWEKLQLLNLSTSALGPDIDADA